MYLNIARLLNDREKCECASIGSLHRPIALEVRLLIYDHQSQSVIYIFIDSPRTEHQRYDLEVHLDPPIGCFATDQ